MSMMLGLLSVLACGGDNGAKHWIQWEQYPLPGDAEGLRADAYCGTHLFANGTRFDAETGEEQPLPGGVYSGLSCIGDTLFASPAGTLESYRSVNGEAFQAMEPPVETAQIRSVLASESRGEVYRSIYYIGDANLPAQVQVSRDEGESWESAGISISNPAGGAARLVNVKHVDSFLAFSVQDESGGGGEIRMDFDGKEVLSTVNSFDVDLAMPLPVLVHDGQALATDAWSPGLDQPEYGLQYFYKTDKDPFEQRAQDYEPILNTGLFFGIEREYNDMFRVVQDTQGRLVVLSNGIAFRSTHPWTESMRDTVIQDKDCERLEWSQAKFDGKTRDDGPGQVTLTHSGGELVVTAILVDNTPEWSGLLEEGEELVLTSDDHPVMLMSAAGECLEVLVAGEDTEVDVGALQ